MTGASADIPKSRSGSVGPHARNKQDTRTLFLKLSIILLQQTSRERDENKMKETNNMKQMLTKKKKNNEKNK